jgi:FeS assembly SUF system regulator
VLRIARLTDYAFVLLAAMVRAEEDRAWSAREIAEMGGVPEASAAKILQALAQAGLLSASRGASGGYRLARPAGCIGAIEVIEALEGPIGLTACAVPGVHTDACADEGRCAVSPHWMHITGVVRDALAEVSLRDLASDTPLRLRRPAPRARESASEVEFGNNAVPSGK